MAFFRYPGGKRKLGKKIIQTLRSMRYDVDEYREPFFGGGAVGLKFFADKPGIHRAWFNDFDLPLAKLWTLAIWDHDELADRMLSYEPAASDFYRFKESLTTATRDEVLADPVKYAFQKIVIHQISYSGLGTRAGGPIGGRNQTGRWTVECRWNAENMLKKIAKTRKLLENIDVRGNCCSSDDFEHCITDDSCRALLYVDPPYWEQGESLYQCGFTEDDHIRLAELLKHTHHKWVLSYDACLQVQELYKWAMIETLDVSYSINTARRKQEFLIRN